MKLNKVLAEAALITGMIFSVFAESVCAYSEDSASVKNDVFRLHILANSDSEEDQALKLKVRNAVLEAGGDIFSEGATAKEAAEKAAKNLELFTETAKETILEAGYDYNVKCSVEKTAFDSRTYGTATLPAGEYMALRIEIGAAEGKNWWCVMFPALCLPAVTNTDEVLLQAEEDGVLTPEEINMIRSPENYEVRFYFADIIKRLADYVNSMNIPSA